MAPAYVDDSDSDVSSMVFSPQLTPSSMPRRASRQRGGIPWTSGLQPQQPQQQQRQQEEG
ncbi:hypothetical protein LPJ61_004420, partial [Coemansia biformis]